LKWNYSPRNNLPMKTHIETIILALVLLTALSLFGQLLALALK